MSELEHEAGILRAENLKLRNEIARLSQQTQHSQPQLTIPKSIADWLDKAFEEYSEEGRMVSTILTMQIIRNVSKRKDIEEWFMDYSIGRLNLALAYLAGKALGVDLVKVVEGINDNY